MRQGLKVQSNARMLATRNVVIVCALVAVVGLLAWWIWYATKQKDDRPEPSPSPPGPPKTPPFADGTTIAPGQIVPNNDARFYRCAASGKKVGYAGLSPAAEDTLTEYTEQADTNALYAYCYEPFLRRPTEEYYTASPSSPRSFIHREGKPFRWGVDLLKCHGEVTASCYDDQSIDPESAKLIKDLGGVYTLKVGNPLTGDARHDEKCVKNSRIEC